MRTQVIPAQITTVEDRIAGNFSLTQILILLTPVFLATIVFVLLSPTMVLTWFKAAIIIASGVISTALAIRIKGKLVIHWIVILVKYNIRPKYYVFNKNDVSYRDLFLPNNKIKKITNTQKTPCIPKNRKPAITVSNLIRLEDLINNKNFNVRFKTGKKGGLDVAFEKITK